MLPQIGQHADDLGGYCNQLVGVAPADMSTGHVIHHMGYYSCIDGADLAHLHLGPDL